MMIMRTRRRLLQVARGLRQERRDAAGGRRVRRRCSRIRSGNFVTENGLGWREAYDRQMQAATRPLQEAAE